jgi:methionyl-tRNA formyltransferase
LKLRVVFAGTPVFALPALRALLAAHQVVGVLTQPDRPAGRGRALAASPVKTEALLNHVPVLQPLRLRGDPNAMAQTIEQMQQWQPDVMVVVAYGLILPQAILDLPPLGCLNIHASLLPRWRGAAPIQRAVLAGDTETGVCIMRMEAGLDTGPVIRRAAIAIAAQITAGELHDQLAALGAAQIVSALDDIIAQRATAVPQPANGITYAEKLSKAQSAIDWQLPAIQIDRQIRALNPWPVAETRLRSEPLKLLRSMLTPASSADKPLLPGTVKGLGDGGLEVACGQGYVTVLEVQRPGRKPVSARDFMNAERATDSAPLVFG